MKEASDLVRSYKKDGEAAKTKKNKSPSSLDPELVSFLTRLISLSDSNRDKLGKLC